MAEKLHQKGLEILWYKMEKCLQSEMAEEFLEILLNLMRLMFILDKEYRKNIMNFAGRYQFNSLDGKICLAATFNSGEMKVAEKTIANPHVTVSFRDGRSLFNFLLAPKQDVLVAMLNRQIHTSGNLNYVSKFGYMAKKISPENAQIMITGLIGNIGRFALHDGPGIRSTVFFKGCPLNCPWCHNSELIPRGPAIFYAKDRCISCEDCIASCSQEAIIRPGDINTSRCNLCKECLRSCPSRALELIGKEFTLAELTEVLLRDSHFYEASGGGVTLSGGEPTLQMDFAQSLVARLGELKIHTAIETSGFFHWSKTADKLFQDIDLIYFDIKLFNAASHQQFIGKQNEVIFNNLNILANHHRKKLIASIPLIPDYTAEEENIQNIIELLQRLQISHYRLLPYHPFGTRGNSIKNGSRRLTIVEVDHWQRFFSKGKLRQHQ